MPIDKKLFPFPTIRDQQKQIIDELNKLDDLRISKLSKQQPRWYTLKMWARLIQACGRSTRSEKDSSVTYILDAAFNRELSRDTSFIPKYFKDRIK